MRRIARQPEVTSVGRRGHRPLALESLEPRVLLNGGPLDLPDPWITQLTNEPPTIDYLWADPDPVVVGDDVTFTAAGVQDSDGTVAGVQFWLDADGDYWFDSGLDELLGTDTSASGGWSLTVSTSGWETDPGVYVAFARAQDNSGAWGDPISVVGVVYETDPWIEQGVLQNPNWEVYLSSYGYSDLLLDETPGLEGREYLSGEWGAALSYNVTGVGPVAPTWLEPNFLYPDWDTNSTFSVVTPLALTGTNADGLPIAQSLVANGDLEVTLTYEMLDTVFGTPMGISPASAGGLGSSVTSNRYVLKQTYTIRNVSGHAITDLDLYQLLHGLCSADGVYDDRAYGGVLDEYRYDVTLRGSDVYYVPGYGDFDTTGLNDYITFSARVAPTAYEIGRYGIEGIDSHSGGKPSVGVHISIEDDSLSGVDSFAPPDLWVAGGQRWGLGSLAAGQSTSFDVLLSVLTGTVVDTSGSFTGIANGGANAVGGVSFSFDDVTLPGSLFAAFYSSDAAELQQLVAAGLFAQPSFGYAGNVFQSWNVGFSGTFGGTIELTFGYNPALLPQGFDPSGLCVYHFHNGLWEPLASIVDGTSNTITVTTDGLSYFALGASGQMNGLRYVGPVDLGNGAVIHVYDCDGIADVTLASIQAKAGKAGVVSSINIVGSAGGLGLEISADSVGSINDTRKGTLDDLGFIVAPQPVKSLTLKSGMTGYNLNGVDLQNTSFADDADQDGDVDDRTALFTFNAVGSIKIGGLLDGDVVLGADGKGQSTQSFTVDLAGQADLLAYGTVKSITARAWTAGTLWATGVGSVKITGLAKGNFEGGMGAAFDVGAGGIGSISVVGGSFAGATSVGSIGNISVVGGDIVGSIISTGGRIANISVSGVPVFQPDDLDPRLGQGWVAGGSIFSPQIQALAVKGKSIGNITLLAGNFGSDGQAVEVGATGDIGNLTIKKLRYKESITEEEVLDEWGDPKLDRNGDPILRRVTTYAYQAGGIWANLDTLGKLGNLASCGGDLAGTIHAAMGMGTLSAQSIVLHQTGTYAGVPVGDSEDEFLRADLTAALSAEPGENAVAVKSIAVNGGDFVGTVNVTGKVGNITTKGYATYDLVTAQLYGGAFTGSINATSLGKVTLGVGDFAGTVDVTNTVGNIALMGGDFTGSVTAGGKVGNVSLKGLGAWLKGTDTDMLEHEQAESNFDGSIDAYAIGNLAVTAGSLTGTLTAWDRIGNISVKVAAANAVIDRWRDPDTGEPNYEVYDGVVYGQTCDFTIHLGGTDGDGNHNNLATIGTIAGTGVDVAVHGEVPFDPALLQISSKPVTYTQTIDLDPDTGKAIKTPATVGGTSFPDVRQLID